MKRLQQEEFKKSVKRIELLKLKAKLERKSGVNPAREKSKSGVENPVDVDKIVMLDSDEKGEKTLSQVIAQPVELVSSGSGGSRSRGGEQGGGGYVSATSHKSGGSRRSRKEERKKYRSFAASSEGGFIPQRTGTTNEKTRKYLGIKNKKKKL